MNSLSIITSFGCEFNCSFCISSSQKSKNEFVLDPFYIRDIEEIIKTKDIDIISISGGDDPLYIHNGHIVLFYKRLKKLAKKYELELAVHTNYLKPLTFFKSFFNKFVVSIHPNDFNLKIRTWVRDNKNILKDIRFVYVLRNNDDDLRIIRQIIRILPKECELTIKPLDKRNNIIIPLNKKIKDLIENSGNDKIMYLPTGDYNIYYNLSDKKLYTVFKKIPKIKKT